ncbi:MAG: Uma2 family endonuclease [Pirellula sp.]|jgi:Uma2 family endonuclease
MSTVPKQFITPEQYLYRERNAEFRSEYFRGEMFAMAGASANHNLILLNAGASLREQLKKKPCRVYPSDLKLRIQATGLYTYPDLSVVCGEPQLESDHGDVLLNPVVLIEVLSDSTEAYDRGKKFEHYRTIPSLKHYVLVAQDRHSIDCFSLNPDGSWSLTACQTPTGMVEIAAIDSQLSAVEVYDKVVFQTITGATAAP